ncbi:hypothetical protein IPJ63_01665 [Candidatus Nomurabacteria bacterium]|nr:MAG: hypothetical protein IPJ63_01665 [Candidatus Nomurabacteria bacterium]
MERETFTVTLWFKETKDGKRERPVSLTYHLDGFYSKKQTNLLYKIYSDVYGQISMSGYGWLDEAVVCIWILPKQPFLPSTLRYCETVKAWLDFIEFQVSVTVSILYEKES